MENISVAVPIKRLEKDTTMANTTPAPDEKKKDEEFESVTLKQCLDDFTAAETVELTCPSCDHKQFTKQSLFKTFPSILAVNARRFEIVNWVPTKQDVPVIVDDNAIDFASYRVHEHCATEELLPEDSDVSSSTAFVPNEGALSMLEGMGFPRVRCEKALHATGNADPESAMQWLFEHMEDADIDDPVDLSSSSKKSGGNASVDPEKIESLANMGFNALQAKGALKKNGDDVERAVNWLFDNPDYTGEEELGADTEEPKEEKKDVQTDTADATFRLQSIVCHKGSSIHAG